MRRAALLALMTACKPSGTVITTAGGGAVATEDGAFTLVLPPDALARDTAISVRALSYGEWPVDAPANFTRIAGVYQIEPAGLELAADAYAIVRPPDPSLLIDETGEVLAAHYQWSPRDTRVRPAPVTRSIRLADGRVAIVGTLYELGTHWVGDRVPGEDRTLTTLRARVDAAAGERSVGETWIARAALEADVPHTLFERGASAAVLSRGAAPSALVPDGSGALRTWDATYDPDLGLHAWEIFAGMPAERTEVRMLLSDRTPVELDGGAGLDPFIDPLPGFRCEAATEAPVDLWIELDVITGASEGVAIVGLTRELGPASCR